MKGLCIDLFFFYKWFWILSYPLIMNGFLFTGRKINQEEKELKHLKSHFMNSQTKKENKVNMNWMTKYFCWSEREWPFSLVGKTSVYLGEVWWEESWLHLFLIQPMSISSRSSVKKDLLVFAVWNLLSALQPPHCLPHVLGLQWWCVSPLFTNIQCCKNKEG